jgi:hypothetical protein
MYYLWKLRVVDRIGLAAAGASDFTACCIGSSLCANTMWMLTELTECGVAVCKGEGHALCGADCQQCLCPHVALCGASAATDDTHAYLDFCHVLWSYEHVHCCKL